MRNIALNRSSALLEKLELPSGFYDSYLEQAQAFLDYALQLYPIVLPFRKPRLLKSRLFRQRYLVANYSPYEETSYKDATAFSTITAGGQNSPPLVLTAKRTDSAKTYNWILEHEFIHIHQMLQGRMPAIQDEPNNPLAFLARRAELEFEAHYLQLIHRGDFDLRETCGMEIEEWSCFRSYTCSLEDTMACILSEQYSLEVAQDFLEKGAARLSSELGHINPFDEFIEGYVRDFPGHIAIALTSLCERARDQFRDEIVLLVKDWVLASLPRQDNGT